MISSAAVAKEFFKTNDASFSSRPKRLSWTVWHNNEDDYKDLALASNGQYWRRLRKFLNAELFSPGRHASHQALREEEIQYMVKILLEDCKKDHVVNLKGWLLGVTCNTMTRMITGKRYAPVNGRQICRSCFATLIQTQYLFLIVQDTIVLQFCLNKPSS